MQAKAEDDHRLTRRGLLVAGGFALAATVLASISLQTGWLRSIYLRLAYPEPDPTATGPIEGDVLETLRVVAENLLGNPSPAERTLQMLQARARELPGHLRMMERFVSWLDHGAARLGAGSFRTALPETQTELVNSCMTLRTASDLKRAWYGLVSRDRVLWDRHILQPALMLYSSTDAWLRLGYDTFPGDPSGLDSYREPPIGNLSGSEIEARK